MAKRLSLPFTQNFSAKTRKLLRTRPKVELLEDRIVPAGNVTATVTGGLLTVTGDNANNDIVIAETAVAGDYQIEGLFGTSVNGLAATQLLVGVTDMNIDMGGANTTDTVHFEGESTGANLSKLTGNLTITNSTALEVTFDTTSFLAAPTDAGFNVLGLTTITETGLFQFLDVDVGGKLGAGIGSRTSLDGGLITFDRNGGSEVTLDDAVARFISDNNGGGEFHGLGISDSVVTDFVCFIGGSGVNTVNIGSPFNEQVTIGGNVAINDIGGNGGGDTDLIGAPGAAHEVVIGGYLSINHQTATDHVTVDIRNTDVNNFLSISLAGENHVNLADDVVGTQTAIWLGDGGSTLDIHNSQFLGTTFNPGDNNGNPMRGAFDVRGGAGNDELEIGNDVGNGGNTVIHGPVSIMGGAGNDVLELGGANLGDETLAFLSTVILDGGPGANTVDPPTPIPALSPNIIAAFGFTEANGW